MKFKDARTRLVIAKCQLRDAKLAYIKAKRYNDAPQFLKKLKEKILNKYHEVKEAQAKFKQYSNQWGEVEDALLEILHISEKYNNEFDTNKQMLKNYISKVNQQISIMQSALPKLEDI